MSVPERARARFTQQLVREVHDGAMPAFLVGRGLGRVSARLQARPASSSAEERGCENFPRRRRPLQHGGGVRRVRGVRSEKTEITARVLCLL